MTIIKPFILLLQNIVAGTRAALFMPIQLWLFRGGFFQICLLLIISFCLSLIYDYFDSFPDNYFNPYGLSYQAMLYLFFFFSLNLLAYINSRQKDLEKLIIMFLSVVPIIWLGTVCLLELAEHQTILDPFQSSWAIFIFYSIWYLLVVFRLIKRFFYIKPMPAFVFMVLYALINFLPLFLLPSQPLWLSRQDVSENVKNKVKQIDIESVYYNQSELVNQAIDNMLEDRKGSTDMFFVGFAGDAKEDVFMNEVIAARDILENHFDTFGRSAMLINNIKTVDQYPLANQYNLGKILKQVATKMNIDEDILFLFLTSHGTEKHFITTDFYPFKLKDLAPEKVRELLDDAGIKWRIIVVSACYSGGFIEPLHSPDTLIITAAREDRNSFGCGHDGEFTYFGDAFFDKALPQTRSFADAFETAKAIIYKKEKDEGFKNSEPQINMGVEIEKKLAVFKQQLDEKSHSNWAITDKKLINDLSIR